MERVPSAAILRQKRSQKKGTKFTIMLCGSQGSGKTTFINTLCGRQISESPVESYDPSGAHRDPGISFRHIAEEIPDDANGPLTLKFIDTPGFGDNIDNTVCFNEILAYIEKQYDDVLAEESRIRRNPRFSDNRVHALLYFVTPTGHGLREMDVEFMKLMSSKVNVVPIISKADSLTKEELALNKQLIIQDVDHYNIPVYEFPDDVESDEDAPTQPSSLRSVMPFAVVGSSHSVVVKGRTILAREYPWGYVDVEDPEISDFPLLRDLLLQTHMGDLKETTFYFLYENYRTDKLSRDIPSRSASPESRSRRVFSNTTTGEGESTSGNSYLAREEQLRLEEEKLRTHELRVQDEIAQKRQELLRREQELKELEARLRRGEAAQASTPAAQAAAASSPTDVTVKTEPLV